MKLTKVLGLGAALVLMGCDADVPAPIEPFNFVEAKIADVQAAIVAGQLSCKDVVEGYLARIETLDKPTGLNAITEINSNAVARAEEIDAALAAGHDVGPLFCAPLLVKDNFDTFDMRTTGGSVALKDSIPPDDAFMVRKLREAGAIILAKTNMAEWAFSPRQTVSSSYGTTTNAYDQTRTPAGSSGGTASGVAANFGVAGMGTDTGNSIRGPSSHLALFGIRSTIGLTSRDGVIPLSFDWDIAGPMTRTVEDGARIFTVVAGYDPNDPFTELGKGRREDDYTAFLQADGLKGARIGILRSLVDTEDADAEVITVFEQAVANLEAAGAEIVDPFAVKNIQMHLDADVFCVRFRYDMQQYLASLGEGTPIKDVMEVYAAGDYSPYIKEGLEFFGGAPLGQHPAEADPPCLDYPSHPGRKAYKDDLISAMDAAEVDAIIYPSWTNPPAPLESAIEDYKGDNSQLVAPPTGLPAVSVPMGYTYGNWPAGLQILGRPYSEGMLIKLAYAYEQATLHRKPPAEFAAEVR